MAAQGAFATVRSKLLPTGAFEVTVRSKCLPQGAFEATVRSRWPPRVPSRPLRTRNGCPRVACKCLQGHCALQMAAPGCLLGYCAREPVALRGCPPGHCTPGSLRGHCALELAARRWLRVHRALEMPSRARRGCPLLTCRLLYAPLRSNCLPIVGVFHAPAYSRLPLATARPLALALARHLPRRHRVRSSLSIHQVQLCRCIVCLRSSRRTALLFRTPRAEPAQAGLARPLRLTQ